MPLGYGMQFARTHVERVVRESSIENYLEAQCAALRVPCKKLKGDNGWFDRVVFWPGGRPSLVELKKPKGWRYEPLQQRTHAEYAALGYDVHVLKTKEEVDKFIRKNVARLTYP